MAKGNKIEWTEKMLWRMKFEFKYAYNKELALELGVSWRSLVRKARELGLEKEEGFLEKRKDHIQRMGRVKRKPNPTKGLKGWSVPGGEVHRFKPGHIPAMVTSLEVRKKVSRTRLKLIEAEKYKNYKRLRQGNKIKIEIMKVKAHWKNLNPFHPDIDRLSYTKTVEVPDDTDLKALEQFAKEDSMDGYWFYKLEVIEAK